MIFTFHLLQALAASIGLMVAYVLCKKDFSEKHELIFMFLILFGIMMFIHLLFDMIINPKEWVIRCYLNLEPCTYEIDRIIDYLMNLPFSHPVEWS